MTCVYNQEVCCLGNASNLVCFAGYLAGLIGSLTRLKSDRIASQPGSSQIDRTASSIGNPSAPLT
ncbi:hypothetical protein ABTP36_19545, partial [Acinetobacter baumannii]